MKEGWGVGALGKWSNGAMEFCSNAPLILNNFYGGMQNVFKI
jgi:hypothetical protein